jgi:hypothetical protein
MKVSGKKLKLGKEQIGLRFLAAGIPADAQIADAFLEFEIEKPVKKGFQLTLYGQPDGAASSFSELAFDLSDRPDSSASVIWNSPASDAEKGVQVLRSPDLSNLLEELAATPGWSPTSAVVLVLDGESGFQVPAFESEPTTNARLHVQLAP